MPVPANRVAVFTAPGRVELRSEELNEPGRGEALVRIRACGLCTMEQRLWSGVQREYPIAAGHETAGVVVASGPGCASSFAPGERVAVAFLDRCMECDACRRGGSNLCTGKMVGRKPNAFRRIGGLADYAVVPAWKLFRMPLARSFEEIALCEPVACVVHSVNKAALRFGDDVLVIGCGTMGYLHLMLSRLRGARVFVSDRDHTRRELALEHGAIAAFDPEEVPARVLESTNGSGVEAVFVTFGSEATALAAAGSVRPGGCVIYYGGFPAGVGTSIDARRLHRDETLLVGARGQTLDDWQQASRLLAGNLVDLQPLISGCYPLAKLSEALERAASASSYRIIVSPELSADELVHVSAEEK
jgi:threonine dehydrogenase-like Zn-dependent dehydrogenase